MTDHTDNQRQDAPDTGGAPEGSYEPDRSMEIAEHPAACASGIPWLVADVVLALAMVGLGVLAASSGSTAAWVGAVVAALGVALISVSLYMVRPNQAAVLTLFGAYRGTDRHAGLRIANPLYSSAGGKVSLRVRNFTTTTSKVNDANGNPIHIAAVVVWRVVDTARASFGVDDFVDYVEIQSESAVRQMARAYPYESFEDPDATTLIGEPAVVNDHLQTELQERADAAGVRIIEARVTDLSYAAEVAEAMLRRQQAAAIVAGRKKIVEGAVGMVRQALTELEQGSTDADAVPLDAARRAAFAANLMTVIASDSPTTPIVNVGSDARH